ncbi:MAG TPA: sugar ABC transporter permease [Candidatus Bathyarchaeota archaeon]|nr:sugar ABC transporter permease [Candidatus Bathyarchaeota archaeon]HEX68982.1 sugar ABC transporter permease [Candidatus Bathyarchaeota archaeon]
MKEKKAKELSETTVALLFLIPLIIFLFGIVIYPIASSFAASFSKVDVRTYAMKFIGLSNYASAFGDPYFIHSLMVTLRFAAEVVILTLGLSLGMALFLNEVIPFRGFFRAVILLPYALSEFATAYAWRWFLGSEWGLLNGILYSLGLIKDYIWFIDYAHSVDWMAVAYSWHIAPLCAFFMLAGLQTIPEDYYRQAKIDGIGPIGRFFKITFPFIKYAILITLVLATFFSATTADIVILMTGGGPGISSSTLTYYIYEITFKSFNFGYGAALSWLLIVIVLILGVTYFILLTKRRM